MINENIKSTIDLQSKVKQTLQTRNCPPCDFQSSSHADLKIHIKTCHTKPNISSPKRNKIQKMSGSESKEMTHSPHGEKADVDIDDTVDVAQVEAACVAIVETAAADVVILEPTEVASFETNDRAIVETAVETLYSNHIQLLDVQDLLSCENCDYHSI